MFRGEQSAPGEPRRPFSAGKNKKARREAGLFFRRYLRYLVTSNSVHMPAAYHGISLG
jgi:hypothetical protein